MYNTIAKPYILAYYNENVWEIGDEICENVVYCFINKKIKDKFKLKCEKREKSDTKYDK